MLNIILDNTDGPQFMMVWLIIFRIYDSVKAAAPTTAPSQSCDHEGEQSIHLQPFCTHTTILFFRIPPDNLHIAIFQHSFLCF